MDLYTLHATLRDALAQDNTLNAWANAQFEKNVTVFSGMSSAEFPDPETDAPFIALGDPEDIRSLVKRYIQYALAGWVGLTNADQRADFATEIVEPVGVRQIADALKLVRNAIASALPDGVAMESFKTAADTLGAHDEVNGYFEVTFIQNLTIGQNPLE